MNPVETNIADLNAVLPEYQRLSGMSAEDVLTKQGAKLGYSVNKALSGIKPPRGGIREAALRRLASGRGIRISDAARRSVAVRIGSRALAGRKNIVGSLTVQQQLIKDEINRRESGRGVLAYSIRYPADVLALGGTLAVSRYGQIMSSARVSVQGENKFARFEWSGLSQISGRVLHGLMKGTRGDEAVAEGVAAVTEDILVYVRRKQSELVAATVHKVVGPMKAE